MLCSRSQQMVFDELAVTEGLPADRSFAERREVDPALAARLEQGVRAEPDNADLWLGLGMVYFEEDFGRTIRCFSRALDCEPFQSDLHHYRGRKYLSEDRFPEALADFTACVRLDPFGRARLAWPFQANGKPQVSAAGRWKVHYLGVAQYFLKDYAAAARSFAQAVELEQKQGIKLIPSSVDWLWMSLMQRGKFDAARRALELVDENTPVEKDDAMYKKRCLLYKGTTTAGDYEKAIEYGHDLHEMTELYGLALYHHFVTGDQDEARRFLKRVLAFRTVHHAFAYKLALEEQTTWKV